VNILPSLLDAVDAVGTIAPGMLFTSFTCIIEVKKKQ
jgi:hypothetical protein